MVWNEIQIDGIEVIEKLVAEFDVMELYLTPYGWFKVKIYEQQNGQFVGYRNLVLKDENRRSYDEAGYGDSISSALADTVNNFMKILKEKQELKDDDFECVNPFEF